MTAEIIAVGTELLLGEIVNTNAQFLAQELAAIGIAVHFQSVVGDNAGRLLEALKEALGRSDVVITTGGLGPTADDLTKETICRALGKEMVLFEDQLEILQKRFEHMNCPMTQNNKKQVMFPEDAIILPNDQGTAPGCALKGGRQMIIMLPGPPIELKPMYQNYVRPLLQEHSGQIIRSRRMEFFGIGESLLETKLRNFMDGANPTVAPYANLGQVSVRVTASGATAAECDALCEDMMEQIRDRVGEYLYGYDGNSMEQVLLRQLQEQDITVSFAEYGTGGVLSQRFTDCGDVSETYGGGFVVEDQDGLTDLLGVDQKILRREGAVCPGTAARMAVLAARLGQTDVGISVCVNPQPTVETGGLAYVGVCAGGHVYVKELDLTNQYTKNRMRYVAATHAFDLARRVTSEELVDTALPLCVFHEEMNWKDENTAVAAQDRSAGSKGRKKGIAMVVAALLVLGIVAGYLVMSVLRPGSEPETQPTSVPSSSQSEEVSPTGAYLEKVGAAYEQNSDVVGYLTCAGIETPLVQGSDNEYYLTHNFSGSEGSTPFVDSRSDRSGTNKNTVIYAPSGDGQPFAFLRQYEDPAYCAENPTIKVGNSTSEQTYKIVSVFYGCVSDSHEKSFPYQDYIAGGSDAENEAFAQELLQRSVVDMGVDVNGSDTFVTLHTNITAYYGGRFVVVARALRPGEEETVDTSAIKEAEDPLMPAAWCIVFGQDPPTQTGAYTSLI